MTDMLMITIPVIKCLLHGLPDVCEYIIEEEMLLSSRFGVAGYGRHRSLYPNNNEHNRAKNRRVEIIIKEMLKDA